MASRRLGGCSAPRTWGGSFDGHIEPPLLDGMLVIPRGNVKTLEHNPQSLGEPALVKKVCHVLLLSFTQGT